MSKTGIFHLVYNHTLKGITLRVYEWRGSDNSILPQEKAYQHMWNKMCPPPCRAWGMLPCFHRRLCLLRGHKHAGHLALSEDWTTCIAKAPTQHSLHMLLISSIPSPLLGAPRTCDGRADTTIAFCRSKRAWAVRLKKTQPVFIVFTSPTTGSCRAALSGADVCSTHSQPVQACNSRSPVSCLSPVETYPPRTVTVWEGESECHLNTVILLLTDTDSPVSSANK